MKSPPPDHGWALDHRDEEEPLHEEEPPRRARVEVSALRPASRGRWLAMVLLGALIGSALALVARGLSGTPAEVRGRGGVARGVPLAPPASPMAGSSGARLARRGSVRRSAIADGGPRSRARAVKPVELGAAVGGLPGAAVGESPPAAVGESPVGESEPPSGGGEPPSTDRRSAGAAIELGFER